MPDPTELRVKEEIKRLYTEQMDGFVATGDEACLYEAQALQRLAERLGYTRVVKFTKTVYDEIMFDEPEMVD